MLLYTLYSVSQYALEIERSLLYYTYLLSIEMRVYSASVCSDRGYASM